MPIFERLFHNLTASPEETRAENLREWAGSIAGVVRIAEVEPRQKCKVGGVIQTIRIDPRSGGSIEVTISDGTGEMAAKWLGRAALSGIKLGEGLIMEGAVGQTQSGMLAVINPEYQLVPGPEHG